jgi:hypothetical protein
MLEIVTDNREHELVSWYDLTEDKKQGNNYLIEPEYQGDVRFFERGGDIYDLQDYMCIAKTLPNASEFEGWDGITQDTYFCGTLIKFVDDSYESVIFGRYYTTD